MLSTLIGLFNKFCIQMYLPSKSSHDFERIMFLKSILKLNMVTPICNPSYMVGEWGRSVEV
jgi:hypothetical protein